MKCQRCLTDEVTYRVYTDALDIEVCFACAKAACRLGIAVEMLNSSETRNSDGFHEDMEKEIPMKFSLVPLLLANQDISAEARKALVENRLRDAAVILMEQNDLTCVEAGQLLDVSAC